MSVLGSIAQAVYVEHNATVESQKNLISCGEQLVHTYFHCHACSHACKTTEITMKNSVWLMVKLATMVARGRS